jgi:hypothetical protein
LKIIFYYFHFHFLIISSSLSFWPFLSCFFIFILFDDLWYYISCSLYFFIELYILNILWFRCLFRKIISFYTNRTNHFYVKLLAKYNVIFETRLNFKIFFMFFSEISKHKHAVSDFFLKEGDLFFDTVPNWILPLCVILFFLLIMRHFNK